MRCARMWTEPSGLDRYSGMLSSRLGMKKTPSQRRRGSEKRMGQEPCMMRALTWTELEGAGGSGLGAASVVRKMELGGGRTAGVGGW